LYNSKSDFSPEEIVKKISPKKKKGKKNCKFRKGNIFIKNLFKKKKEN
jgi:hypothetical protein